MSDKDLIIDTNLLLLLVIGAVENGRHIRNSSRLNQFNEDDYQTVIKVMSEYKKVCITPYIATEVSNLIDLNGHAYVLAMEIARELFKLFETLETNIEADCTPAHFLQYGITDSSLISLVTDYTVLTNDNRLLAPLYDACPENVLPYAVIKAIRSKR
ncbi:PIN domain-containing protein [Pseudomonas monteilii]|uniref:PIN domain-containing protein n=1 Tax=Pseudomonas monteilii TaxID=76759 RepID=A0A399M0I1_9PSED|nr:hypothetical protein [Pseudomonas monteilii]RII74807.1 hypothetical protein D0894_24770 [Pseudomonas monteilii]